MDSLTKPMKGIFAKTTIEELREYLAGQSDISDLRKQLYDCFRKHSHYRNVSEWNTAVRLCEALAIIGWGEYEPVEAIRSTYFNGNPNTYFLNRDSRSRFLDAVWSKRKDGLAIDYSLSFFHDGNGNPTKSIGETQDLALCSQRNWIAKNPIRLTRGIANCYATSRELIESIETELAPMLHRDMHPEAYGSAIDVIILNLSFSFYDNDHCKTNYIIADESRKLKKSDFYSKLLEMYSEKEIADNGYYLRNRFSYGPFRKDTGTTRVDIVLEKDFSLLSTEEQKRLLSEYLLQAVSQVAKRLSRKIDYDFDLLISDFKSILQSWNK